MPGVAIDIDISTPFGERVARRLAAEPIGWLTTTSPKGAPVPSPVWFLWDGESFLIYSQDGVPKLRNIAANPRVSLHLDGDGGGGDIVILSGTAAVSDDPPASQVPEYVAKYAGLIAGNGWSNEQFAADYPVPLRVTPSRLRGH